MANFPQQSLNFFPLPHGQGESRGRFLCIVTGVFLFLYLFFTAISKASNSAAFMTNPRFIGIELKLTSLETVGTSIVVISPLIPICGPAYRIPIKNSLTPEHKLPSLSRYAPMFAKKTGDPEEPGKQAASIRNSFFPLSGRFMLVAVMPFRITGILCLLSHIPFG